MTARLLPAGPSRSPTITRDGGIGQAITAIRERKGVPLKLAAIGVGSGTLACAPANG